MYNGLPAWTALAPALLLGLTGLALLLVDTIRPRSRSNTSMAVVGALGALASLAVTVWFVVAGYLLSAMQKTLFGPFRLETDYEVTSAPFHDVAPLAVLLVAIIVLGVAPDLVFEMIRDATMPVVEGVSANV